MIDLAVLVLSCAPLVAPDTARALIQVESGGNPFAIYVVGGALVRQPANLPEALATVAALQAAGWNYSVGLGQINKRNFQHSGHGERVSGDSTAAELVGQRQLAAASEKALVDGKVSPELRGQVRAMMTAEGAKWLARGDRFKVPVYDSRAPRARSKSAQIVAHRADDWEGSRFPAPV